MTGGIIHAVLQSSGHTGSFWPFHPSASRLAVQVLQCTAGTSFPHRCSRNRPKAKARGFNLDGDPDSDEESGAAAVWLHLSFRHDQVRAICDLCLLLLERLCLDKTATRAASRPGLLEISLANIHGSLKNQGQLI